MKRYTMGRFEGRLIMFLTKISDLKDGVSNVLVDPSQDPNKPKRIKLEEVTDPSDGLHLPIQNMPEFYVRWCLVSPPMTRVQIYYEDMFHWTYG